MRPRAIIWFERLMAAMVIVGLIYFGLAWQGAVRWAVERGLDPTTYMVRKLLLTLGAYALIAVAVVFVSRCRSRIAAALLVLQFCYVLRAPAQLIIAGRFREYPWVFSTQLALEAVALTLLLAGGSRAWLNRATPSDLGETFS